MYKNRCTKCNCKIGLVFFICKCNNKYCSSHLLPELHECTSMELFKKEARDKITKTILRETEKEKTNWI